MNKIVYAVLILLSFVIAGCSTNSMPPDMQKNYALLVPVENNSSMIAAIDEENFSSLSGTTRDVLPGRHSVKITTCAGMSNCADRYFTFEAKAGLAYVFISSRAIAVFDRFDRKKQLDTLVQKDTRIGNSPFIPSKEADQYHAEQLQQQNDENAAKQAAIIERRKQNLSLVNKIGARICQDRSAKASSRYTLNYVYVGYVEALAEDKVQIRVADAIAKASVPNPYAGGITSTKSTRPDDFSPSVIWDSPLNWDLCE